MSARGKSPRAEAIRSDIDLRARGITWVDSQYDERLGEVLRPDCPDWPDFKKAACIVADRRGCTLADAEERLTVAIGVSKVLASGERVELESLEAWLANVLPAAARPPAQGRKRGRKLGQGSFVEPDEPLVEKMRAMTQAGRTAWDAAQELAPSAAGGGSAESKAKRLLKRYSAKFSD